MRLLLVSAGALATLGLSTGTAHADTNLVGEVVKQAHSVVKSTHQKVHRTPANAAAPVRHTASTVAKAGRHVTTPVQRVVMPRHSSATRPATTVHRVVRTTPSKRVVHVPVKKVVHPAGKPVRAAAVKTPAVKIPAVKTSAVKLAKVVKLPKVVKPPKVAKTARLLTAIDRELLGPVATSPLLDPVLEPVRQAVSPVLETVRAPLAPIASVPLPVPPRPAPSVSDPIRSVPGIAPVASTAAAPVSNDPTPNVSGVGSATSRSGLAAVAHTVVEHAVDVVDRVAHGTGPVVLGSLGSLVVMVAVGASATGTASAGSAGSPVFALLERGPLGVAATSNCRYGDGSRLASWSLARHPGFAPD